jgi:hypothetical protein
LKSLPQIPQISLKILGSMVGIFLVILVILVICGKLYLLDLYELCLKVTAFVATGTITDGTRITAAAPKAKVSYNRGLPNPNEKVMGPCICPAFLLLGNCSFNI